MSVTDTKEKTTSGAENGKDTEALRSGFVPVDAFEMVIFGATGDLARRKIFPALYHRFMDGQIPENSRIIGVSRSEHSREEFLTLIYENYCEFEGKDSIEVESWSTFIALIDYVPIDVVGDKDWSRLSKLLGKNTGLIRVFYLAMPPSMFSGICQGLKREGLAHKKARVVLEKPIGTDFASAHVINEGVAQVFDENRIYRIDHYLGKETVQNLLVLRFGNVLLEPLWNSNAIDHIEITVAEAIGVSGRGAYYDSAGALRDMVQNHLLQLLCLSTMEAPSSLGADDVRTEKIKVLRALERITVENVKEKTVRGQYTNGRLNGKSVSGYLDDLDVDKSNTETFVAIKAEIQNWRWAGVPIYLRTGKRMSSRRSEIVIQFKSVPHSIFGAETVVNPNKLVIRLQPDEAVKLYMEIKEPGAGGLRLKTLPLNLSYADNFTVRYPDAYERLLMDVVRGNLGLFMRRDEVEAAWRWCDGLLEAWAERGQVAMPYFAGTDGPEAAHQMLSELGHRWSED